MDEQDNKQLSEREMLIAKEAAKIAVKEIQDSFYKEVGKGVITKALVWIGLAVVAFMAGRGYIKFP
jgi:hypothetical protein